jgi:hypothetical protein
MTKRSRGTLLSGLAVILCACSGGGGGGGGGSTSTTSPASNVPVSVTKQSGDVQTGTVGTTIAAPVVKVVNFSGAGVAGIAVTFTASGGDVLGATSATTGPDGTASAGSWRLSTVAGTHTVSASAAGVAIPASFTAMVNADVARTMTKTAGDNQTGFQGVAVQTRPAVTLADQYGNPVPGSGITFTVASGGGTITGGTQQTSATGVATVGSWVLGQTVGANSLTAASSVAGVPAVTFTATGIVDPCQTMVNLNIPQSINGTLTANDCLFAGDYYADLYTFTTTGAQQAQVDMLSTAFRPFIDLGTVQNDYFAFDTDSAGGSLARIRLLGPARQYLAFANTFAERATGAYTFSTSLWNGDVANCANDVWIVPNPTPYSQNMQATDCTGTATVGQVYFDAFFFWADSGRTYTYTAASTAIDPNLLIRAFNPNTGAFVTVGSDDNSGGGTTARLTWTPSASTTGVIFVSTAAATSTGAYTLNFTRSGTAALNAPITLPLGRVRATRRPAFAGVGAPSAYWPTPAERGARDGRRP